MTRTLRIAVPIDLDWPLKRHQEPYSGIQDYARQHAPHWELVLDEFPGSWIRPGGRTPGYDAIIGRISKPTADAARRARIPVVNVWSSSPVADRTPSVLVDFAEMGRMAGEHLVSRGLRRLGGIGYRQDVGTRQHFEGLRAVAKAAGITVTFHMASFQNRRNERNWRRYIDDLEAWMDQWTTPMGIATVYDTSARTVATMCLRRGLKIPEDVAIIGGGDEPVQCESTEPELSSVDMGHYRQGYEAAKLLDQLLHGAPPPKGPIMTPPADLVARQSTDVYAVADKTVGRAMRFIAENCSKPIRVPDVVEYVGCGRGKLERQFRAAGRQSINQEIVALRIELTKRLLAGTDAPIEDVAARAGFGTAQHMRHVFRHQLKITPTEYRQQHRTIK